LDKVFVGEEILVVEFVMHYSPMLVYLALCHLNGKRT